LNERSLLDHRYLQFVFRASRHLPVLISGIAPALQDLRSEVDAEAVVPIGQLREDGARLVEDCAAVDDDVARFVTEEIGAITTQLEVAAGGDFAYADLCSRLLGTEVAPVADDVLARLRADALVRAADVIGAGGDDVVRAWETRGVVGDAKVQEVSELLDDHRARCAQRFPIRPVTGIDVTKTDDPVVSVGAWYYGRRASVLEVNPALARQHATLVFEVAHNALPGDLFHLAAMEERWLEREGLLIGGIKVKNTPDNVISEGLEDLGAAFLFDDDPPPDVALVLVLEELRRSVAVNAALALRHDGRPEAEVRELMADVGLMNDSRVEQTLRLIRHPLWGTYIYTYVGGRNLVGPAWRRERRAGREAEFFTTLFTDLLTPKIFGARFAAPEAAVAAE
jgi:hypothetical protein